MDQRESESLNQIDLDQSIESIHSKGEQNLEREGLQEKAAERIDQINLVLNHELRNQLDVLGFKGDKSQIYQQTALIVQFFTLTIATFISMLISQISFLDAAWTFIPGVYQFFILLFALSICLIQFQSESISKPRWNFIICLLHIISKIILIIYLTIWLYDIRLEAILVNIDLLIGYIWFLIYVRTQRNEYINLTISENWKRIFIYEIGITTFLIFLIRSDWKIWIFMNLFTILYSFFLLLSLSQFQNHLYFQTDQNDLYLGSLQIDADFFIPCCMCNRKQQRNGSQSSQHSQKNQNLQINLKSKTDEWNEALISNNDNNKPQSQKSIAEI